MLFGYVLPEGYTSAGHTGPFTLLSTNYEAMLDGSPGIKTLFHQTSAGVQTLTLNFSFGAHFQSELASTPTLIARPYPYLLLGVVNIGVKRDDFYGGGQMRPDVAFTLSGKWAGGGVKTCTAVVGASGYAGAWTLVRMDEQVGGGSTPTVSVALTADFTSGAGAFGNFGIGEVVIVPCDYLPVSSIKVGGGGGGIENRTSGNVGWPALRTAFRTANATLALKTRADSFLAKPSSAGQSRPLQRMFLRALGTGSCVIAPYWRVPGTQGPDLSILAENAMMARLVSPLPDISGNASDDMYRGSNLNFEELL